MLVLFVACLCIAVWGFNSVVIEVAKRRPREPHFSLRNRYEVDAFIWSERASCPLRRRYVLCMACGVLAFLCLGQLVWANEMHAGRRLIGVGLAGLFALIGTVSLTRKVIRHGI